MTSPKAKAASSIPSEGEFLKSFMRMQTIVAKLYQDQKRGEQCGPYHAVGKE